jgi:hypothetical protein
MRIVLFAILLVFVSCRHNPFIAEPGVLSINPASVMLHTGDSVLLEVKPGNNASWKIEPEIGEITSGNYYKAPSSILNDSVKVLLKASNGTETASSTVTVIKKDINDTAISFSRTILPLMEGNCNFKGCHGNGSKAGKVELNNYTNTMKTVYPYQPGKSLLYISLVKADPLRRMPPAGALHQYRIDYFKKWIEQGAIE